MTTFSDEKLQIHIKREKDKGRLLRKSSWWRTQQPVCYYCRKNPVPADELTMDHIVPLSQWGRSTKNNLVVCCKNCNNQKKNMTAVEWLLIQGQNG